MNVFQEKFVSIEEVWFDEELKDKPKVDIVHYIERSQPIQQHSTLMNFIQF
jgi:hypothetical protein